MTPFDRLVEEVVADQDRRDERPDLATVKARLAEGRPRTLHRRPRALAVALAALVGAALLWAGWSSFSGEVLAVRVGDEGPAASVGQWIAASRVPVPLVFSDGSRMELDPGARGHLVRLDRAGADLVLESGRASVQIIPRKGARFSVLAGPFEVLVTGTRFDVSWTPDQDRFELALHEGSVTVSGCSSSALHRILPGQSVRASCSGGRFEVTRGVLAPEPEAAPPSVPPEPEASSAPDVPPSAREPRAAPPSYREHLAARRYEEAMAAASSQGFSTECERADSLTLVRLGDAARFTGRPDEARLAYLAVRRRFAGGRDASEAAFRLGRLAFDHRGSPREAAEWFGTYLTERPRGPFAREARGRLMEALERAGDAAGARRVATEYLAEHPGGPHEKLAAALVRGDDAEE